jgi:hypothetical protein
MPAVSPAQRVSRELPAVARATADRPYTVIPKPGWRQALSQPRYVAAIAAGVLAVGAIAAVLVLKLGNDEQPATPRSAPASAVVPGDVHVAVLNGTDVPGLAASVGDDLSGAGFKLGAITNSPNPSSRSSVAYERGHEQEAKAVAGQLGIDKISVIPGDVEQIVADASNATGMAPAPVVVIAGTDRASGSTPPAPSAPAP